MKDDSAPSIFCNEKGFLGIWDLKGGFGSSKNNPCAMNRCHPSVRLLANHSKRIPSDA